LAEMYGLKPVPFTQIEVFWTGSENST